jgi:arabinofuranosyltransferase
MTRRGWLAAIGVSAAGFYAAFIGRTAFEADGTIYFTLFDDAMVSMRYARNLADGHGLVWNTGSASVEGFSNLLWTLWMAALHAAGIPEPKVALGVMLSSAALLLLTAAAVYSTATAMIADRPEPPVVAAALVAFSYPLVFWSLRGLEVSLVAFAIAGSLLAACRLRHAWTAGPRVAYSALTIAAVLTRQDAVVAQAVIGAYLIWIAPPARRVGAAWLVATACVAPFAAHVLFSVWYYGAPLPNTYYLKLSGATVCERAARGAAALAASVARHLAPLLVVACAARSWKRAVADRDTALAACGVVAAQAGYSVYAGGDAWEWMGYANRYLSSALPALAILVGLGLARVCADLAASRRLLAALLAVTAGRFVAVAILARAGRGVDGFLQTTHDAHPAAFAAALGCGSVALLAAAAMVAHNAAGGRTPASPPALRLAALAVTIAALVNGEAIVGWVRHRGFAVDDDIRAARIGLLIRQSTTADAVVAATWAGAIPYFSQRSSIDILGKSDPFIARMRPVISFVPGHDKWDLRHSIGRFRPDVVTGLPLRPADLEYLEAAGYAAIANTGFVKRDSRKVDLSSLNHPVRGPG